MYTKILSVIKCLHKTKLRESLSVLVYLLQYVYVLAVFSPKQTQKKQAMICMTERQLAILLNNIC